jgi:hypothetical protein
MLRAPDLDGVRTIVLVVLGLGLAASVVGWRDADATLRVVIPLIGVVQLGGAWTLRRHPAWPRNAVAAGAWFSTFGVMLSRTHAGECAAVSGQCDIGPDLSLDRAAAWLEPAIQRPVAIAFLLAGIALVALAVRSRRRAAV